MIDLEEAVNAVDRMLADRTDSVDESNRRYTAFQRRVWPLIPCHAPRPQAPQAVATLVQAADALGIPRQRANDK